MKCVFSYHLRLPHWLTNYSVNSWLSVVLKNDHCRKNASHLTLSVDKSFHLTAEHISREEMACRHSLPLCIHGFLCINGSTALCWPRKFCSHGSRDSWNLLTVTRKYRWGICGLSFYNWQIPVSEAESGWFYTVNMHQCSSLSILWTARWSTSDTQPCLA